MVIEKYRPELQTIWDDFVRHSSEASIYHETWWMEVVTRCFAHQNVSLIAFDDKRVVQGVLPLFIVKGWVGRRLVSVPLRDQAGILGAEAAQTALLNEAKAIAERENSAYLALKQGADLKADSGLVKYSHWVTNEVKLPFSVSQVKDAVMRNVRKAEKNELDVASGAGPDLAKRFYALFRETRKRLGVPTYSQSFFTELAKHPDSVIFFLCSKNGKDLAGAAVLYSGQRAAYGYAANTLDGREFRAADLVIYHALKWASDKGLKTFDFGADSPLQTELRRFKQKWGAQERTLHYYYYLQKAKSVPSQDNAEPKWKWIRKTISMLPSFPFEVFSHWVVKHVD